jgi:heme A synthase
MKYLAIYRLPFAIHRLLTKAGLLAIVGGLFAAYLYKKLRKWIPRKYTTIKCGGT